MKTSNNRLNGNLNDLSRNYETALRQHLKQSTSDNLQLAVEVSHQAIALGAGTLDIVLIHEQALLKQILPTDAEVGLKGEMLRRAGTFFTEVITPIEQGHCNAIEFNKQLSLINEELSERTQDLATSYKKLKKEIGKREKAEKTLRKSEQQTNILLEQSQLMQQQLRSLSRKVWIAQEEERKKISRELHDVIAQLLTGINVRLTSLKKDTTLNTKNFSREISNAQRLVEKSVDIVHNFACELRPAMLDDLGLIPTLHSHLTKFTEESGVRATLTAFKEVEKLSNTKRTVIYRVVQEALTNVERHAEANQVDVCIRKHPSSVGVIIKDDGKAFDVTKIWKSSKTQRLGLLGMRERVEMVRGKFQIKSTPGQGTSILIDIPLKNSRPESNDS
ncbi:MAG: histidine kinase [Kiritimatiellia bacterium]